jgi:hypothetical protein
LKWFECKVLDATLNLLQWFEVHYPQKDKAHCTIKVVDLWNKVSWWAKFTKTSLKKLKLTPWIKVVTKNFLTQIGSCGVLWILSMRNVLPLSKKQLGWLWWVCKVWIERSNHIPNTIELARRTPKTNDK